MTARRLDPEPVLLGALRAGIALVLLTPLVTAPWTLYPFSVGKALWARVLIAVLFALWAVLALLRPRWRPPWSALLAALAAGLAAGVLSAESGVGPTAVRFRICGQGAWLGFNWDLDVPVESKLGLEPKPCVIRIRYSGV